MPFTKDMDLKIIYDKSLLNNKQFCNAAFMIDFHLENEFYSKTKLLTWTVIPCYK